MATDGWKNFQNIVEMQAEMNPIDSETTVKTDQLNGQDLSDNVVGDVYYNVGNDGYDATDQSIVISITEGRFFCYILVPADNRKTDSCQSFDLSDACSEVSRQSDNILLSFFR